MRKIILFALLLAACSSPKYTYQFSRYHESSAAITPDGQTPAVITQAEWQTATVSASLSPAVVEQNTREILGSAEVNKSVMTKQERKAIRKELRSEMKDLRKELKSKDDNDRVKGTEHEKGTKAMDNDLKLAAIFGAIGLVALLISGDVFYIIGGIALIIGVVFFVMWLSRQ